MRSIRPAARRAFTLLEVTLSVLFFTMMVLLIAATLPIAARSSRQGADTAQASSLLMHKIDQLQNAGYNKLDAANLPTLGIVDGADTLPPSNPTGTGSGGANFTVVDRLNAYFTNAAAEPHGRIEIAPYQPSQQGSGGGVSYNVVQATVSMIWRDSRGQGRSLSMRTLIPKTRLQ